jgi:Na+/H+-dicarboxylate symporter
VLPLVVFALLFGLALTALAAERRATVVNLFEAIADTLLVIITWVLWIARSACFALAYSVGAAAGGAAFRRLGH